MSAKKPNSTTAKKAVVVADGSDRTDGEKPARKKGVENEKAPAASVATDAQHHQRQADHQVLYDLGQQAELFHSSDGRALATIKLDEKHVATYLLESYEFKGWLVRTFKRKTGRIPTTSAIGESIDLLAAQASFDRPERPVTVRVARFEDRVFVDLGNDEWQVLRIGPEGHQVLNEAPVKFIRPQGFQALPFPRDGGSINQLRPFVNASDEDFQLIVAFMVGALRPEGPFPVLEIQGEQGTGKSTLTRVIRSLIDPNKNAIRVMPKNLRDLAIAAGNSWLLPFDNVSHISEEMSDGVCRLATGAAFATRRLYTNDIEALFEARRPVMINGIGDLAERPDLIDRMLSVTLQPIAPDKRRDEQTFWAQFNEVRPAIFGALVGIVTAALRDVKKTTLVEAPRMADFAKWVTAAEPALGWSSGTLLRLMKRNDEGNKGRVFEATVLPKLLTALLSNQRCWEGTADELLQTLESIADPNVRIANSPAALGKELSRLKPLLRSSGIEILDNRQGGSGQRCKKICRIETSSVSPVGPVSDEAQAA